MQQIFIPVSTPPGTSIFGTDGNQQTALFTVSHGATNTGQTQFSNAITGDSKVAILPQRYLNQHSGNPVTHHQIIQPNISSTCASSGGLQTSFIIAQQQQIPNQSPCYPLIPMSVESLPPNCVFIPMASVTSSTEATQQSSVLSGMPQSVTNANNVPIQMTNIRFINTTNQQVENMLHRTGGHVGGICQPNTGGFITNTKLEQQLSHDGGKSTICLTSSEEALRSLSITNSQVYDPHDSMETGSMSVASRIPHVQRRGSNTETTLPSLPENFDESQLMFHRGGGIPPPSVGGVSIAGSKQCSICGDRSTGKHYGVFSCEGCKGFFKRTVRQKLSYICRDNNDCSVDKQSRNRCQACRWRRCLTEGMKREYVQLKRPSESDLQSEDMCDDDYIHYNPPTQQVNNVANNHDQSSHYNPHHHHHHHQQQQQHHSQQAAYSMEDDSYTSSIGPCTAAVAPVLSAIDPVDPDALMDCIKADEDLSEKFVIEIEMEFYRPFPTYSPPTSFYGNKDKSETKIIDVDSQIPQRPAVSPVHEITQPSEACVPTIVQACQLQLYLMVEWVKKIPHFMALPLSDQINLTKGSWCEILCLTFGCRSSEVSSGLLMCTGVHVTPEVARDWGVSYIIDRIDQQLVRRLRSLDMDRVELGCLKLILLFNPSVEFLSNEDHVKSSRQKVFRLLASHSTKTHPGNKCRFSELMMAIAPIRIIALKCLEQLGHLQMLGETELDKFLTEMLNQSREDM